MTRDEKSLLVHLETRVVDHAGFVAMEKLNSEEKALARQWDMEGLIAFGPVGAEERLPSRTWTHRVQFTDPAWAQAHAARREMAEAVLPTLPSQRENGGQA